MGTKRLIGLGFVALLSSSCFSKSNSTTSNQQSLVEQSKDTLPHLADVCPVKTVYTYKISCSGGTVSVSSETNRWSSAFEGEDLKVSILTKDLLLVTSLFEGSLSFIDSRIVELNTGHILMDNDGGLIFNDSVSAIFAPTGSAIGHFSYAPTLYYFDFKTKAMEMLNYKILPRKNCGIDENDVTLTQSTSDVYIKDGSVIFPRQDNCGPFYYSSSIKEK